MELYVGGSEARLSQQVVGSGNIPFPALVGLLPITVKRKRTSWGAAWLSDAVSVSLSSWSRTCVGNLSPSCPAGNAAVSVVPVQVNGLNAPASTSVPAWRLRTDSVTNETSVSSLSSIVVTIVYFENGFEVATIDANHTTVEWSGPRSDLPATLPGRNVYVSVEVRDAGEPSPPLVSLYKGFYRSIVGAVMCLAGFALTIAYCTFQYTIRRNASQNRNLPPPFFGGWTKTRGW